MKSKKIKKLIRKEINKILPLFMEELLNIIDYQNNYNKSDDIKKDAKEKGVVDKSNTTFDEDMRFNNIKKEYPEIDEIKDKVQQTFFPGNENRFVNYLAEAVLLNKRIINKDVNWKDEYYNNLFNEFRKFVSNYNDVYYNKIKKDSSLNDELNNFTTLNDLKKESINNNNKLVIDLDELKKENVEQKINNMTNEANNS